MSSIKPDHEANGAGLRANAYILSVERTCRLLELFSAERPGLTLAQMVELLGWSRATTHRYAMALRETAFLRYEDGEYRAGPKTIPLAAAAIAGLPLVTIANPHMARLARAARVTAILSVVGDSAPIVVSIFEDTGHLVSVHVPLGTRLPLLNSAHGDISLAFEPTLQAELERAAQEDRSLARRVSAVRKRRFAVNADLVTGICGIAAPISVQGKMLGALGLLGTTAMLPKDLGSEQAELLRHTCDQIAAECGETVVANRPHRTGKDRTNVVDL